MMLAMAAAVAGLLIAVGGYFALAGPDESERSEADRPVASSPAAFLARVDEALRARGEVPHVKGETIGIAAGQTTPMWSSEAWYDFDSASARSLWRKAPGNSLDLPDEIVRLRQGEDVYVATPGSDDPVQRFSSNEMPACFEDEPDNLAFELICGFMAQQGPAQRLAVEPDVDFRGQAAHALVVFADGGYEHRLFVDPDSYVPIGHATTAQSLDRTFVMETAYHIDGVERDSLRPGYFTPEDMGYVSPEDQWLLVLDDPALGMPVYWPGRVITSASEYDAVLTHVDDRRGPRNKNTPGHVMTLSYRGANGLFRLDYWPEATWDEFRALLGEGFLWANCAEEAAAPTLAGEVVILRGHEVPGGPSLATPHIVTPGVPAPTPAPFESPFRGGCPDGAYDRFMAVLRVQGGVVTINAPYGLFDDGNAFGTFDTEAGLLAIAERLRLRQPGE